LPSSITKDGKEWLKVALDPFHDEETNNHGLPDNDTSKTIIQVIKKQLTIKKPTAGAGAWSFIVFSLPELYSQIVYPGQWMTGQYYQIVGDSAAHSTVNISTAAIQLNTQPAADYYAVGYINVWIWNTDVQAFFPNGSNSWTPPDEIHHFAINPATDLATFDSNSRMRIVGQGFEVVNTTAALYKGGSVTAARVPNPERQHQALVINSDALLLNATPSAGAAMGSQTVPFTVSMSGGPPSSIEDAMAYPGTLTWGAESGVYQSVVGDMTRNQLKGASLHARGFAASDYLPVAAPTVIDSMTGVYTPTHVYDDANGSVQPIVQQLSQSAPFQISSAMFNGLNENSTFILTSRLYLEISPRLTDPRFGQLVYSTQKSADFDPAALAYYQLVSTVMPVGCRQTDNPSGEFWNSIVSLGRKAANFISKAAGPVGAIAGFIPGPVGSAVGTAARVVQTVAPMIASSPKDAKLRREVEAVEDTVKAIAKKLGPAKTKKKKVKISTRSASASSSRASSKASRKKK